MPRRRHLSKKGKRPGTRTHAPGRSLFPALTRTGIGRAIPGKRAFSTPSKGVQKTIGPTSWRHIVIKQTNPPLPGSGGGGPLNTAVSIGGPQTLRAQGPTLY